MSANRGPNEQGVACALSRMRWCAVLLLLIVLTACRSAAIDDVRPTADASLDVVTLNLWHDRGDWPRRQLMIVDELRRLGPDVILLQEVLQDVGLPNQAYELAQELGYHAYFVSVDAPDRARRYGNAILTREPASLRDSRRLQPDDDYRIAGWVRMTVDGTPVNVYVVHLNFTDRSGATRAQQVRDLLAFVEDTRGDAPVVIGGDFNAVAGGEEFAPLRAAFVDGYAVAHRGVDVETPAHSTLNPVFGHAPQRIDHVFAQVGALRPLQARRVFERPAADGVWASDHFGVWVRLQREPVR